MTEENAPCLKRESLSELAMIMALVAHRGQVDRGGQPYIWHPIRVALHFQDEVLRAVALLHDVLEDSDITADEMRLSVGDTVTDAVVALTKTQGQEYDTFIDQCAGNDLARAVKIADLLDNMNPDRLPQPLKQADWKRLAKYAAALSKLQQK